MNLLLKYILKSNVHVLDINCMPERTEHPEMLLQNVLLHLFNKLVFDQQKHLVKHETVLTFKYTYN